MVSESGPTKHRIEIVNDWAKVDVPLLVACYAFTAVLVGGLFLLLAVIT
jgi:hypothetical protein